jgi:Xaa-Pro dipeptidase
MTMNISLDPRLAAIHGAEYPRFTDPEFERRRAALERVMQDEGVDHLLICGEQRIGSGVGWLTGWPVTTEAYVIVGPGEPLVMFMEWYNHWPLAKKMAAGVDVRWAGIKALTR